MKTRALLVPCVCWLAFTTGCALLTKATPTVPRYFSPERPEASAAVTPSSTSGLSVRMGRVGGGSYLKERMAFRDSDHEFGFYEDRRWTERPEVYLERALETTLYEQRGVKRALAQSAPTLTADLVEFEEVKGSAPRVRLRVSYALHDETTVFLERTLAVERPLPAGDDATQPDRVAAALGDALDEAVKRIDDEVIAALGASTAKTVSQPPTTR
jgi:ABC-type uncharacterized transport system auxiliary subunit